MYKNNYSLLKFIKKHQPVDINTLKYKFNKDITVQLNVLLSKNLIAYKSKGIDNKGRVLYSNEIVITDKGLNHIKRTHSLNISKYRKCLIDILVSMVTAIITAILTTLITIYIKNSL